MNEYRVESRIESTCLARLGLPAQRALEKLTQVFMKYIACNNACGTRVAWRVFPPLFPHV